MDIRQKLYWLIQAGISTFCTDTPKRADVSLVIQGDMPATDQASAVAYQAKDLDTLNKDKQAFSLSSLKKMAAHTLLGQGPTKPKLMCILEIPDAGEDKSGQIFVGAQGEQLKKMMAAIHLDIENDVYVSFLSPWRTPGNRPLTTAERALFLPFLMREIELVQPQKILLFGAGVSNSLLATESVAKARGIWHEWQGIPTRVTLAINSLKTTPLRQQAWDDLQEVEKILFT